MDAQSLPGSACHRRQENSLAPHDPAFPGAARLCSVPQAQDELLRQLAAFPFAEFRLC